jgi:phosphoglucosamine mutase
MRLFGTDGVRGVAGEFPLDETTIERLGAALVRALPHQGRALRLIAGRDTRESSARWPGASTRRPQRSRPQG